LTSCCSDVQQRPPEISFDGFARSIADLRPCKDLDEVDRLYCDDVTSTVDAVDRAMQLLEIVKDLSNPVIYDSGIKPVTRAV
jgi:hypothetical protein